MVKKGYKQTKIGVIPEDWDCREINSEIKEISMGPFGSDIPVSSFTSEGVPVLNGHSVSKVKLIDTFKNYVSEEKAKSLKKAVAQQGDIIVTHRGTIGQISYIPIGSRYKKYVISQSQFRVRLNEDSVNPHFVASYFLSPKGQSFLLEKKGHTGVPALAQPTTNFRKLCIPLPSLPEQDRIVNAFEDIDDLISSLEKQISKKKAIKQGTMQELLTGKRRLPGFFGEWETFVFGDLFDFIPNNAFTRAQLSDSGKVKNIHYGDILTKFGAYISADSNEIPYIEREIDLSRFAEKSYLQSGDIVIADTAEDDTVGKALEVINVECPVLAGQHTLLCRPKANFAEKFLGYYLNAACYHDQLLPFIVGTKVSSISKASVAQTRLAVPKYEEQQAISCILSDMDDEITELEQKLEKYRQVKQGMMQQLLTGKIRLV